MLHAIDGKTERTFAVPCGDLSAAGENYIAAIKADFVAIKSNPGGITPDMLKYLADSRGTYWTDTFISIMRYVKNQQHQAP
jgi:hypothetical protein